ncbi:MAG: type II toxin-antitoxin system RatA family toxin [Betaproteobacteria bacterium]|nr:type II toxin-antitoxin system RatA family toxin [Betaproteobacteria bacterium]
MPCIERQALVPYSPQSMFDLVASVERYPQFLPWCAATHIIARRDDGLDASLQVRFKGIQQSFSTRNHHDAPRLIRMQLLDGPFERLEGAWHFDALQSGAGSGENASDLQIQGTKVSLRLAYQMKSGLIASLFSPAFDMIAAQMMDAFLARAEQSLER